jgi:hypothetical protein
MITFKIRVKVVAALPLYDTFWEINLVSTWRGPSVHYMQRMEPWLTRTIKPKIFRV